jgi:hypothetical protein
MNIKITSIILIALALLVWGASNFFKEDSYIGFYYPDISNLSIDIQSNNSFSSLEGCRNWVEEQRFTRNPDQSKQDDYECGKNCRLQNGQKPYICEETLE